MFSLDKNNSRVSVTPMVLGEFQFYSSLKVGGSPIELVFNDEAKKDLILSLDVVEMLALRPGYQGDPRRQACEMALMSVKAREIPTHENPNVLRINPPAGQ